MRALCISADQFEDSELTDPVAALEAAGVDVDIATPVPGTITGKHGTRVEAGLNPRQVDPARYDLLLLPGGKAPAELRRHDTVLDIARCFADAGKAIAAICHGPQILISADRVKGREMTCYHTVARELEAAGARYLDRDLVVDDNLISSRHPGDLPVFNEQIVTTLTRLATAAP